MKVYLVGGAVRDKLLGLPVKDRDWVVIGSTPEEMESLGYKPVGRDFPVFLHPQTHEEYALARTERKTGPGYKGFSFHTSADVTLEQDLIRRDITINALAEDENGEIIDLYKGQNDLKSGILRHISPAFIEDPLRVVRVARFAARFNFTVADETMELMKDLSESGELESLVPDRVWVDFEKALDTRHPTQFFEVLRQCSALKILFPEIDQLFGVPQPPEHHPEIDTGIHTMLVLSQACLLSDDLTARFAALVHDLGKGTTPKDKLPHHHGHEQRSVKLVKKLCDRYRVPNRYRELALVVAKEHQTCHKINELRADTVARKLDLIDAFRRPDRFEQYLKACEADAKGRTGFEQINYYNADIFRKYYEAAKNIDTQSLIDSGLEGIELGNSIRKMRIKAIEAVKSS